MTHSRIILLLSFFIFCTCAAYPQNPRSRHDQERHSRDHAKLSGQITSSEEEIIAYATISLKDTNYGGTSGENGQYGFIAPAGNYILVVSALGYKTTEIPVKLESGRMCRTDAVLQSKSTDIENVVIRASGVSRVKESAYNAVAIDTKALQNSTQNLSDALIQAPGLKLRESGGVGSDMHLMLDGFSGKHIKIFIDGVPQEGVGSSFGLNNIPVNFAERIEVYKGVVPVGFGTDAIGGVINVVTKKDNRADKNRWFLDASYSFGSFNTHKSYVNFGQTLKNGFTYEINAFQNYSDNNYWNDAPIKQFIGDNESSTSSKLYRVRRFHDTYHNEAVIGKVGIVGKKWADRLIFGFNYSQMYKEIQTGVTREVVFGGKYRKGHSVMPSLEYSKRDLFTKGLDVNFTANYNRNISYNIDTCSYEFNWLGEKRLRQQGPGEQSYQNMRSDNNNWNGTLTATYRLSKAHTFTFNHVITSYRRNNESLLEKGSGANAIPKETYKNISGLSYRLMPSDRWNLSVFGKYYDQFVAGPVSVSTSQDKYERRTKSVNSLGYGAAGTYYILTGFQAKLSYEKAYRLPSENEMFGDEDMESGDVELKPEHSDNLNFTLSYDKTFGKHLLYVEGGLIYRDTKDYIKRELQDLSGGKIGAGYTNHGRVLTKGYTVSVRYGFSKWLSLGGTFTQMDARDNEKKNQTGSTSNRYRSRMPNVPYQFSNADITFYWRDLGKKGNILTVIYDNLYLHSFPRYSEANGSTDSKKNVPTQFSHNLTVSYSMKNGRYNLSLECRNFTDEKLYDNFYLQKAGRAFYGKLRVYFGN